MTFFKHLGLWTIASAFVAASFKIWPKRHYFLSAQQRHLRIGSYILVAPRKIRYKLHNRGYANDTILTPAREELLFLLPIALGGLSYASFAS